MVVYVAFARTSGLAAIEWYKCPELPGRQEELTPGGEGSDSLMTPNTYKFSLTLKKGIPKRARGLFKDHHLRSIGR